MKPPYEITPAIIDLISSVSEKIGEIKSAQLQVPPAELRKKNRVRTIHSSLAIEGNTLSLEQVSTLLENKRVVGPMKDILEVRNAIDVYDGFESLKALKQPSFLKAHKMLMQGLTADAGKYRTKGVGIVKGNKIAHVAPPASQVKPLMNNLFAWLKSKKEHPLVAACVFHYEVEFIHPFSDGNGRMGRLWQSVILSDQYPVFRFLPVETLVKQNQKKYYKALSDSDKQGASTIFMEFMLTIINKSLEELLLNQRTTLTAEDRIAQIPELFGAVLFSRKDYLRKFKGISTATASRDLEEAVSRKIIQKTGKHNQSRYRLR